MLMYIPINILECFFLRFELIHYIIYNDVQ